MSNVLVIGPLVSTTTSKQVFNQNGNLRNTDIKYDSYKLQVELYEQRFPDTTTNILTDLSYNSHPYHVEDNYHSAELLNNIHLLQISPPNPHSLTTLPCSITRAVEEQHSKVEISTAQRSLADHPDVDWCAYYGDQKGFTCCLKSQKIISAVRDYEDFLSKLESGKSKK